MLSNLFDSASDDSLMGLSVWGNPSKNIFFDYLDELCRQSGFTNSDSRSNFYLYNTVDKLLEQCGWEIVLNWEQVALYPFIQHDENNLSLFMKSIVDRFPSNIQKKFLNKLDELINVKKVGIQFSCQMLIVRKIKSVQIN